MICIVFRVSLSLSEYGFQTKNTAEKLGIVNLPRLSSSMNSEDTLSVASSTVLFVERQSEMYIIFFFIGSVNWCKNRVSDYMKSWITLMLSGTISLVQLGHLEVTLLSGMIYNFKSLYNTCFFATVITFTVLI